MRPTLPSSRTTALATLLFLTTSSPVAAQLDTTNLPQRPAEQLARLNRFFGTYVYTDNYYGGLGPWRGTLTVRPAIKDWYVEWTINTRYGPIDRQLTMLTTWDDTLGRYRIWRFETIPPARPGAVEAEGHWSGDEFIMEEKESRGPDGHRGTFRNRIHMEGPDTLVIVTEVEPENGDTFQLGVWRSVRIQGKTSSGKSRR
jgi:hypothetical protein